MRGRRTQAWVSVLGTTYSSPECGVIPSLSQNEIAKAHSSSIGPAYRASMRYCCATTDDGICVTIAPVSA